MVTSSKRKFFKVYSGPGYPIDPVKDLARALDGYINVFRPAAPRTYDFTALHQWLLRGGN